MHYSMVKCATSWECQTLHSECHQSDCPVQVQQFLYNSNTCSVFFGCVNFSDFYGSANYDVSVFGFTDLSILNSISVRLFEKFATE